MSLCEYCNKESKLLFVCSQCGRRFCKEHRNQENHECGHLNQEDEVEEISEQPLNAVIDEPTIQPVEEEPSLPVILTSTDVAESEENIQEKIDIETPYDENEYVKTETNDVSIEPNSKEPEHKKENEILKIFTQFTEYKLQFAIVIIVTLITGALTGILVYPQEDTENLQQRYDALYEYYTKLQSQNQAIYQDLENITLEINRLEEELQETQQMFSSLQEDWNSVFSDQTHYSKLTVNELRKWIAEDQTDQQTLTPEHTPLHQALLLSLKAKTQGWKLGVITIYGNFTTSLNNYTYNIIKIDDGLFEDACVYLNPQTDQVFWNSNYDKIATGQIWSIGEYSSVYISKIETILEP